MSSMFSTELFNRIPVVGIMRNIPGQQMEQLAGQYQKAGLTTLEITMNSPDAVESISSLVAAFAGRLNIGAGTVCSLRDLDAALKAGAQFIVTPVLNEEVIRTCTAQNIPVFPGAYTPTEIYTAWSLGATMVKVFPATRLGASYIKEVLAPLNDIKLLPTGGINTENFRDFLRAGAAGLGMGSQLFPASLIENGRWEELGYFFSDFVNNYQDFKSDNAVK